MPVTEEEKYQFCPNCKNKLERKVTDSEYHPACSNCGFIFWNNPKPVVSIILSEDGGILMLQRASEPLKDYWCLPGGFIRYGETPQDAIRREVKEETGLSEIEIKGIVGAWRIDNDPRGIHIDIIYHGISKGELKLSSEDKTYAFYKPETLPKLIAYKHREAVNDWFRNTTI